MHAFFSTLMGFILNPFLWVICLLIMAALLRKPRFKKYCMIAAIAIGIVFSNSMLLNWFARQYQPAPVNLAADANFSCGIIAGGFASPDRDGNGNFNAAADRFIQALRLYKMNQISHIMITGGNGKTALKTFREANYVKQELMIMGVPDSAILVEDLSKNTAENAQHAKQLLNGAHLPAPYLLISSAHHLPRAVLLFKKAGLPVQPYPTNYIAGRGISSAADLLPSLETMLTWPVFLKEAAAYAWYSFKD